MGVARSTVTDLRVVPALTDEAIGFTGNGAPRLSLAVIPGVRLVVEASTDLVQWDLIADTTPATSVLFVTDQVGRGSDHRFYRVQFPEP